MPTTEYLPLVGGRIAYDDTGGEAPATVLLPGAGDRRGAYRFLAPRLAEAGYRVVTMDLRGLGDSSAEWNDYSQPALGLDLIELLTELDLGPAVLIGHSYAAGAVIWAAANSPTRVAGIVTICGFFRDLPHGRGARLAEAVIAKSPLVWSQFYRYTHGTPKPPDLRAWRAGLVAMLREPGRRSAFAAMLLGPMPEGERWAPTVNCPVLVIGAGKDPLFADPLGETEMQAKLLGGQVGMVDDAGHYPHSGYPNEVAGLILPFLAQAFHT